MYPKLHKVIGEIAEDAWAPIPYWLDGAAKVAETVYTPFGGRGKATALRLIVRRADAGKPARVRGLRPNVSRPDPRAMLDLEADHRAHTVAENVIRDLKDGGPWITFPPGDSLPTSPGSPLT